MTLFVVCVSQIAEKRRLQQMEKERERQEEERENKRLEDQRIRMQQEYEVEQKKIRDREEEVMASQCFDGKYDKKSIKQGMQRNIIAFTIFLHST